MSIISCDVNSIFNILRISTYTLCSNIEVLKIKKKTTFHISFIHVNLFSPNYQKNSMSTLHLDEP